jgi:hypothetical protein
LVSILFLHLKLLWSFHALFTHKNVQLGALDIKTGTYEAKFAVKCHVCGISLGTGGDFYLHQNCWAPPSLPVDGYRWLSPRHKAVSTWKLATHLHLVLVLWICGFVPSLPHMPHWHGAYLHTRTASALLVGWWNSTLTCIILDVQCSTNELPSRIKCFMPESVQWVV